jgi:glycosyltransferase involved in cell wall biosynthesis
MIGHVKYAFLGNARAFMFPIHWEEPFGLVMAEAMACGTPVIGYARGSVPEIVRDGVTGFIIDPPDGDGFPISESGKWIIKKRGVEGLIEAIGRVREIDRAACRRHVEENFTVEKMVAGYEEVYKKIIERAR